MPHGRGKLVNATAAALLALLHDGPMTGGQLVAAAGRRFGASFPLTRSQVYRELPTLAAAGLLRPGDHGPRGSQPYAITAAGRRAFSAWLGAGAGAGATALRSPLLLRLLHAGLLSPQQRAELVAGGRAEYTGQLQAAGGAAAGEADPYRRAVAEFVLAHDRAMLTLLDAIEKV